MRVGKLKNGKDASKDEITREMIKGGGDRVVDWFWSLCNMAFESGVGIRERGLNVRTIELLTF